MTRSVLSSCGHRTGERQAFGLKGVIYEMASGENIIPHLDIEADPIPRTPILVYI